MENKLLTKENVLNNLSNYGNISLKEIEDIKLNSTIIDYLDKSDMTLIEKLEFDKNYGDYLGDVVFDFPNDVNLEDFLCNIRNNIFLKILYSNIPYKEDNVSTEHQHRLQLNKNDLVKITYKNELNNSDLILYIENKEKVNKVYEVLKDNQIEYTTYKDNHLEGTIKVEKNQIIFTSIPYDENWHITIDGKETKPIRLLNSLMGIECNEGIHKISLKYNKNYIIPTTISVSTLTLFIIYCIYQKKKND